MHEYLKVEEIPETTILAGLVTHEGQDVFICHRLFPICYSLHTPRKTDFCACIASPSSLVIASTGSLSSAEKQSGEEGKLMKSQDTASLLLCGAAIVLQNDGIRMRGESSYKSAGLSKSSKEGV